MSKYTFSIITVCYNAQDTIANTISSLLGQNCDDYEYIVKDGKSSDNTLDITNSLVKESNKVHIVSEEDNGIYDAMNEAVKMAQGEYIYFLNAGDRFAEKDILTRIKNELSIKQADVIYGNIIQLHDDNRAIIRKYSNICRNRLYFLSGDCICHQAMFARRELFDSQNFDTSYKVCADREWQLFNITRNKTFHYIDANIANVLTTGFSTAHQNAYEEETYRCIKQYCKRELWIYQMVMHIKKNRILLSICRKMEDKLFR